MANEDLIMAKLEAIEKIATLGAKNALNIEDVVFLTGLSKYMIYQLTSKKQIPYYKPKGKTIYFKKSEIEAWLLTNRVNTEAEAENNAIKYCL